MSAPGGHWIECVAAMALMVLLATPTLGTAGPAVASPDSTGAVAREGPAHWVGPLGSTAGSFDSLTTRQMRVRHAYSFDHLLEFLPGYLVRRTGPIGGTAGFSRYAMGLGRGIVYLGSVPLNDPQDDIAPLALTPTTAVGRMVFENSTSRYTGIGSNIEGVIQTLPPPVPSRLPTAFFELSRGDRKLRQRRARFSSARGTIGIDYSYDEVLNSGYNFDSRELVTGPDMGSARARTQTLDFRGQLPGKSSYRFSFRDLFHRFQGDLRRSDNERQREGAIGLIEVDVGEIHLAAYDRRYATTQFDAIDAGLGVSFEPVAQTENHTFGGLASIEALSGPQSSLTLGATYEEILSYQNFEGAAADDRLRRASVGARGNRPLPAELGLRYGLDLQHDLDMSTGWGGSVRVTRALTPRHRVSIEAKRGFRMPNLGELFMPVHDDITGRGQRVVGNRFAKSEHSLEGAARLYSALGVVEHEIRAAFIRVDDPLLPVTVIADSVEVQRVENGTAEDMRVVENRLRAQGTIGGTSLIAWGGAEFTFGTRERFLAGTPKARVNATLAVGRSFFQNSSDILFTAEYQFTSTRKSRAGDMLPSYNVLNLKLDWRLVDAQLYIMWLNVFDEEYQSVFPFLMTPRTFVYGVSWTLLD